MTRLPMRTIGAWVDGLAFRLAKIRTAPPGAPVRTATTRAFGSDTLILDVYVGRAWGSAEVPMRALAAAYGTDAEQVTQDARAVRILGEAVRRALAAVRVELLRSP